MESLFSTRGIVSKPEPNALASGRQRQIHASWLPEASALSITRIFRTVWCRPLPACPAGTKVWKARKTHIFYSCPLPARLAGAQVSTATSYPNSYSCRTRRAGDASEQTKMWVILRASAYGSRIFYGIWSAVMNHRTPKLAVVPQSRTVI